jgi:hypothetical protein
VIKLLVRAGVLTGAGVLVPDFPPAARARIEILRERVERDGGVEVTCGGVSMEPVIARGEKVRIRHGRVQRGAVVAFVTRDGVLELHRLVARAPRGWWAHLGDNQAAPHVGLVHAAQIVGVADVPVRRPSAADTARAMARFGRAAINVRRNQRSPRRS